MAKELSHRIRPFTLAKAFEIPKDFSRKVLWSGFGADSPNLQYTQKSTAMPCFLFFHKQLELRSKPCFKALLKKHLKNPQNFPTETHHFTLAKLLKFSKKLFSKSFFDWGLGRKPQHSTPHKKARHCRAFYFNNHPIKSPNFCKRYFLSFQAHA